MQKTVARQSTDEGIQVDSIKTTVAPQTVARHTILKQKSRRKTDLLLKIIKKRRHAHTGRIKKSRHSRKHYFASLIKQCAGCKFPECRYGVNIPCFNVSVDNTWKLNDAPGTLCTTLGCVSEQDLHVTPVMSDNWTFRWGQWFDPTHNGCTWKHSTELYKKDGSEMIYAPLVNLEKLTQMA